MKLRLIICLILFSASSYAEKPLFKDFMGINGHFHFKPELYNQVCRLVRNYHNINWDVVKLGDKPTFPVCANKVNWKDHAYGPWTKAGFEIDICAQFGSFGRDNKNFKGLWKGQEKWAYDYGYQMAKYFGPSGKEKLCTSIEIGNEPGNEFDDALYKKIFSNMAKGIRAGDKKVKIVTCTAQAIESDKYSKELTETFGSTDIKNLYDVINVHVYAIKPKSKNYSPWDRSYPEDPILAHLKVVDDAISWRNKNAKGKEVWITEFGWDACTDDMISKRDGWFKKLNWTDVTDLQQAQYLVRVFFCFAERDIDRAYIYYYNDDNKPSVHAASGLTRKFQPKMSFWAVKHLYETLGDYRFSKIIKKQKDLYVYEFMHGTKKSSKIWVAWSPTGSNVEKEMTISSLPGKPAKIERMPSEKGAAPDVKWKAVGRAIKLKVSESPVYIIMN